VLLAISAWLFNAGLLTAITQTIAWCVIFFFASAGASAAYLTVSEIFPVEVRAKAIAVAKKGRPQLEVQMVQEHEQLAQRRPTDWPG